MPLQRSSVNTKESFTHNPVLYTLPKSVLVELLFPLLDAELLAKIHSINFEFNALIENKTILQEFCDKYFPYLLETTPQAYQNNPKRLFLKEMKQFKKIKIPLFSKQNTMHLVLTSLSGEIDAIDSSTIPS